MAGTEQDMNISTAIVTVVDEHRPTVMFKSE